MTEPDFDFNNLNEIIRSTPSPQPPTNPTRLQESDGAPVGVNGLSTNEDTIIEPKHLSKNSTPIGYSNRSFNTVETKPKEHHVDVYGNLNFAPLHISSIFYSSSPGLPQFGPMGTKKERSSSLPTPPLYNSSKKIMAETNTGNEEDEGIVFEMDEIGQDVPDDTDPKNDNGFDHNQFNGMPAYYSNNSGSYGLESPRYNTGNVRTSANVHPQTGNTQVGMGQHYFGRSLSANFATYSAPPSTTNSAINSPRNFGAITSPREMSSGSMSSSPSATSASSFQNSQSTDPRLNPALLSAFGEHPLGEHPSRTLFVRNINSNVEDEELVSLFSQYGPIRSIYTQCKHRGFVMISYFDIRHAKNAMRHLQNRVLRRRKLDIHYSIPKENPSEKDQSQGTLVVFNLDPAVSTDELKSVFGAYGEIKEIRETPNKKHHKFIEFYDIRDAEKAMKYLNKTELKGKKIKIEHSRPGGARKMGNGSGGTSSNGTASYESGTHLLYSASPANEYLDDDDEFPTTALPSAMSQLSMTLTLDPSSTPYTPSTALPSNPAPPSNMPYNTVNSSGTTLSKQSSMTSVSSTGSVNSAVMTPSLSSGPASPKALHVDYTQQPVQQVISPTGQPPNVFAPKPANPPSNWLVRKLNANTGSFFKSFSLPNSAVASPSSLSPVSSRSPSRSPSPPPGPIQNSGNSFFSQFEPISKPNHTTLQLNQLNHIATRGYSASDPPMPHWSNTSPRVGQQFQNNKPEFFATTDFEGGTALSKTASLPDYSQIPESNSNGSSAPHTPRRRGSNASQDDKLKYILDISKVASGEDERTTLMIKNIPNKYTQKMLLNTVNDTHKGTYDFFYLPIDFKNRCNVGYAFINFLHAKHIVSFYKEFHNKKWEKFNSEKVCELTYGRIQGKVSLIGHFQNSSLMCEDKKCRPIIFHSNGVNSGEQEPFPLGANLPMRRSKDKEKDSSNPTSTTASPRPSSPINQTS